MQAGSYCAQPDLHTGRYGRDVDGTISAPHSFGKSDLEYGSGAPRSGGRRFLGEGGEGLRHLFRPVSHGGRNGCPAVPPDPEKRKRIKSLNNYIQFENL